MSQYTGLHVDWRNDYRQLFDKCNWYDFCVFQLEFEWDKLLGGVVLTFYLLGLGFRLRYNYTETPELEELKKMINEVDDEAI